MVEIKTYVMGQGGTNCYIISNESKDCVVVDCDGDISAMARYLDRNGLKPEYIILTHGHDDHIGSVEELAEKYGSKIAAGRLETDMLANPELNLSSFIGGRPVSIKPDTLLDDGERFNAGGLEFKVMHTPGHTQGGICLIIEDKLISGDTLFAGSCGRTDFPGGDWGQMTKSLKRLAALEGDYTVYPGHGPATTLAQERRMNPYM